MGRFYDATWGKAFAEGYDRTLRAAEEAGLREIRRRALAEASGRTIDIGAGTGVNAPLYPASITHLVLAEPDPHMIRMLKEKIREGAEMEIVQAPAENLPFPDDSFDTAVFSMSLCTIPVPTVALHEAARILKPDGALLFVEHVRAKRPGLARWQDRLEKPWRFFADGCHCNRDTVATIAGSPDFELERVERAEMPKVPPLVRPMALGRARLSV